MTGLDRRLNAFRPDLADETLRGQVNVAERQIELQRSRARSLVTTHTIKSFRASKV